MIGHLKIVVFVLGALVLLLILLPPHILCLVAARFGYPRGAGIAPVWFHRGILRLMGVRLHVSRPLPLERPLLVVSNHVSWLDIVVLGAVAPLSFVAKSEMKSWPVFGWLAQLQRTVFVAREKRRDAGQQANAVADRMAAREIMVLFPEATTTDGNKLHAFKTPLFEAARFALVQAKMEQALIQPVAINYNRLHGLPMDRHWRTYVAWPGEIGLGESMIPLVRRGALDVTVQIGEPIAFDHRSNRKEISAATHSAIRKLLSMR